MPHDGQTGITFDSGGHRLLGRLFLAQGDDPKPTAVILHGLPGIEQNYDIAFMLRERGWNAVIFHYRGCWGSGGDYTFKTIPADVRACLDTLSSGAHPQVDASKLILIGHSLGGWAAVLEAVDDQRVRAVIVIGSVTDPRTLPLYETPDEFIPWLPTLSAESFRQQWQALDAEFAAVEQVARLAPRPLFILHSPDDTGVPLAQALELFERARNPKTLISHPGANHAFTWHRDVLRNYLAEWLDSLEL
jgi:hypothetical protein